MLASNTIMIRSYCTYDLWSRNAPLHIEALFTLYSLWIACMDVVSAAKGKTWYILMYTKIVNSFEHINVTYYSDSYILFKYYPSQLDT